MKKEIADRLAVRNAKRRIVRRDKKMIDHQDRIPIVRLVVKKETHRTDREILVRAPTVAMPNLKLILIHQRLRSL